MRYPWYAHHIPDYESKTAHLSLIKHGAYRTLIDHYYKVGGPLKANASDLLRVCRAVDEAERQAVLDVLAEFFTERDGFYHLPRADEEIAKRAAISEKRAAAGRSGGSKPKSKRQPNGEANEKQLLKQLPTQEHIQVQSLKASPTEKPLETTRERAGVRKAPAPHARPIDTEALAASMAVHEPDWADRDPVWAQVKPEISVTHWRLFFHKLRETETPGEYIANSSFDAERLEADFGPMLARKLGYEPKFLPPPRRSTGATPTKEARH